MNQEDLFKKYFNIFLLKNSEKMLKKALRISYLDKSNHLLMQAFTLCEYKNNEIYFIKKNMEDRINIYFNEIIKYSYSISKTTDLFSNEHITDLRNRFDFIKNIPDNYLEIFQENQKEVFKKYWDNNKKGDEKIKEILKSNDTNGEIYAKILFYFLGDEFNYNKKNNEIVLTKKIEKDTHLSIIINAKQINQEIKNYKRLPPSPIFINGFLLIESHKFTLNRIELPNISSIIYYNNNFLSALQENNPETALKWLFLQCDTTAFYIKMSFEFYQECFLSYIKENS
ncbi:hypothetical protein [Acinetobacter sp. ESBL14]|uniref:hypothetical protein n=1 Tax=Acinetobacter sp. ESBL14 TaxID=3077329 RepID=UPI002FC86657